MLNMRRIVFILSILSTAAFAHAQAPPKMKFSEVREIAPGVFFRYAAISATDKSVFGGCNNVWIVFKDYVLVYDANFPKEAGDVIKAVRKTTNKPIRYLLDSHHHGDHAYGNAIWAKAGASIIAQKNCNHWLRTRGLDEFTKAGKGPTGRKDIAASFLKIPDIVFDKKLVFDDGMQRVEILHFGHCHTPGDAQLYLPKYKILCTGDSCVNGAFNYTGHSNTASWVKNLEKMQQFDIKLILPGHGLPATKELLAKQRKYFVEMRQTIKKEIAAGRELEDIKKRIDIPWYKEWTGVAAKDRIENIQHIYDEFTGRVLDWNLAEDFGIYQAITPTKKTPGWVKPKRIVVPNLMPDKLAELKRIAPKVFFIPVRTEKEAAKEAASADAVLGYGSIDTLRAGKNLRWVQPAGSGLDGKSRANLRSRKNVVVTNVFGANGSDKAEQAFALMLALNRQNKGKFQPKDLSGKTLVVIGFEATGKHIARRANAFGMRVIAITETGNEECPDYVFALHDFGSLMSQLPNADVLALACPLTLRTKELIGEKQFAAMKKSAIFINVARSGLVETKSLTKAIKRERIAGTGLDVTDPNPLPQNRALAELPNVVISKGLGGASPAARAKQWRLWRENVRRFVNGEPLLCVEGR